MQIVQNKAIALSNSLGPRTRVTADILGELNLLNDETRVKQPRLNHVNKLFYDLRRTYPKENFFSFKRSASIYSTSSNCYSFLVRHFHGLDKSTFFYT